MILGYWKKYKLKIAQNCDTSLEESMDGVNYWRNRLFASTLIFILPFCFIAMLPVLVLNIYKNVSTIILLDIVTICIMCFIAFMPRISLNVRKTIFSCTVFAFAVSLNTLTPSSGPVLVYMMAGCIYSIIIFDNKYAYWWSHFVLLLSVLIGVAIQFNLLQFSNNIDLKSVTEWAAVSSNLVFLCYLSSALIPQIFRGIENYILEQERLRMELEKSTKTLQAKNEELEQYAYIASHDLQEPLRMVSSFMEKLKKKYAGLLDDKGLQYIHYATDGANRMKQIIQDLLLYSRINASTEEPGKVILNDVLAEYLDLRRKLITDKKAEIKYKNLPELKSLKVPLTQIIHSLLDNAIKYTKVDEPPIIEIEALDKGEFWQFAIKDNGIGIDKRFHDKVFIIFQRLHNRSEFDGTGIGLAIAKRAVAFLGGEIWVESKVGEGTTFYFTISKIPDKTEKTR